MDSNSEPRLALMTTAAWHPSRALLVYGAWALVATLICASVALDSAGSQSGAIPAIRVVLTFIEAFVWANCTLLCFWLVARFPPERYTALTRTGIHLLSGVLVVLFVTWVMEGIRAALSGADVNRPFAPTSAIGIAITSLIYVGVLGIALARYHLRRAQDHRNAEQALRSQALQLNTQLVDARLRMLRAQLNPHFLFNTLHAISALTTRNPARVRDMLARLSDLLRITLEETHDRRVSLERELTYIRKYCELMSLQLPSPISLEERIDAAARAALVPALLLQPLIENAFVHGLARRDAPGTLAVHAAAAGDDLRLRIVNSLGAHRGAAGEGLGLRNTRERLEQLYGSEGYRLSAGTEADGSGVPALFVVEIRMPLHPGPVTP